MTTTVLPGASRAAPGVGRPQSSRARPSSGKRSCTRSSTWLLKLDDGDQAGWRTVSESEYTACLPGDRYPDCTKKETP